MKKNLKAKLRNAKLKIKKHESINNEQKSKLEEITMEKESLQKLLVEKEKDIINLKNEIQQKKENNSFNQTFYTRDQMIALTFYHLIQNYILQYHV